MSHPDELLADYVDGTLTTGQRADVEAHLTSCARCREEVSLASAGRRALRSARDVPVPPGIADRAIAEAAAPADVDAARASRSPQRWLGAAAAIAAVVVLLAVAAPKLGSSPSSTAAAGAGAEGATDASFAVATGVEVAQADVRSDDLAALAATAGGVEGPQAASGGSAAAVPTLTPVRTDDAALPQATACLTSAFGDSPGTLTRVVAARYEGTPAYLGFYAVGPGAGLPATRIQLLVASVDGCRPLATAYALL
jgi:anti-sigma factor RsiW